MWPFDMFSKKMKYTAKEAGSYYSKRYNKTISWPRGYQHDGATFAPDLSERASRIHDRLCEETVWDDGTPVTNWQASTVYSDALREDGLWMFVPFRWTGTYLGGGEKLQGSIAGKIKGLP